MSQPSPKQNHQTGQNPVSQATVKSVRLTIAERAAVEKDKSAQRKEHLKFLEADAQAFVKDFQTAKGVNNDANTLHRKFKELVQQMRPVFERVREGFAHLKKGETIMGEETGPAWADKYLGVTYDWLCRCLNTPQAGTLLLTDGTKVVSPSDSTTEAGDVNKKPRRRKLKQAIPTVPATLTADSTDSEFIKTCVRLIESTLRPLESDPQRFHRIAVAIAQEILGEMGCPSDEMAEGEDAQATTAYPALSGAESRPAQNSFSSDSRT